MYTGTLIDDLMATVDRVEEQTTTREEHDQQIAYWHEATTYEMKLTGQNLLGVA
jgi:hypothetical protein